MIADRLSSLFLLAVGGTVIYFSMALGVGSVTEIGPGFIPFWCGVILCILSLGVLLQVRKAARKSKQPTVMELWAGENWSKPVIVAFLIVAYIVLFNRLGFIFDTTIFLMALLRTIKPVKWGITIGTAIAISLITFVVFDLWLKVQLPHQIVENLLYNISRTMM
jgi:putative tricarboxylic transport membrane protein